MPILNKKNLLIGSLIFLTINTANATSLTNHLTNSAQTQYSAWKTNFINTWQGADGKTSARVLFNNSSYLPTVSEGIGYGMLLAVAAKDQATFDALWHYEIGERNNNGLMMWYVDKNGQPMDNGADTGGATDADQDMAYALILADKQWGTSPNYGYVYKTEATAQIQRIWNYEVDANDSGGNNTSYPWSGAMIMPGDSWGPAGAYTVFSSYIAPEEYLAFDNYSSAGQNWDQVRTNALSVLEGLQNSANGLLPDNGSDGSKTSAYNNYTYDATRVPWRLGLYLMNGNKDGYQTVLNNLMTFLDNQFTTNNGLASGGYNYQNGTVIGSSNGGDVEFTGPAMVGEFALNGSSKTYNGYYNLVSNYQIQPLDPTSGAYFNGSLDVLMLFTQAGALNY